MKLVYKTVHYLFLHIHQRERFSIEIFVMFLIYHVNGKLCFLNFARLN